MEEEDLGKIKITSIDITGKCNQRQEELQI